MEILFVRVILDPNASRAMTTIPPVTINAIVAAFETTGVTGNEELTILWIHFLRLLTLSNNCLKKGTSRKYPKYN